MANWDLLQSRGKVEDRRGIGSIVGGIGLTGAVALIAINFLLGGDITDALNILNQVPIQTEQVDTSQFEGLDEYEIFASTVLGSANNTRQENFGSLNRDYTEPKLVLFRNSTDTGCGLASSEVGPFYCLLDQTIYLDETFFDELQSRFGAQGGDVAQAYVIAHEVGHHVQSQLGELDSRPTQAFQIASELQADCYAGIWAYSIRDRGVLDTGEIKEAIDAAAAVGDDRIQKSVAGYVNPEAWTHGSSEQRVEAFTKGFETGDLNLCKF